MAVISLDSGLFVVPGGESVECVVCGSVFDRFEANYPVAVKEEPCCSNCSFQCAGCGDPFLLIEASEYKEDLYCSPCYKKEEAC